MRFPSTRRERGGGKKERRESTRTRTQERARARRVYVRPRVYAFTRVHASVARSVCTGRKRTYVQRESREARARDKDGERKGGSGGETGRRIVCMYHQKSVPGY